MRRVISSYYFLSYVVMASAGPFLSLYLKQNGLDGTKIGLLLAAGSIVGILVQPVLGLVNDRAKDARWILLISATLSPIVFAGYAVFHHFWTYLCVAVIGAIVGSAAGPIADAIAITQAQKNGFTYGQIRLWGALGFALMTMIGGYVYHRVGLISAFYVYGALSLFLVLITFRLPRTMAPTSRQNEQSSNAAEMEAFTDGHSRSNGERFFTALLNVARHPALLLFICINVLLSIAVTVNYSYLPLYYQELHYPMGSVGLNYAVAALVEVPFFFVSGKLMNRFGRMPTLIVGTLVYAFKYAVMAFAPNAVVVIALQILDGIGFALSWSAAVEMVNVLAPSGKNATAQSLFGAISGGGGGLSSIIGTTGGGLVLDKLGPQVMYGLIATLAAAAAILFSIFARTRLHKHAVKIALAGHVEPTISS